MNRMKAPSYIMKYRELRLKVPERKMNTSLDDEGTIADNEGVKGIILGFFLQMAPHKILSTMDIPVVLYHKTPPTNRLTGCTQ